MKPSELRPLGRTSLRAALLAAAVVSGLSLGVTGPARAQAQNETAKNGLSAAENSAGAKGAKTYCFLRASGNTHQVSWDAAYALIKRQGGSLFKTSPEHAAVMITEAVVNNPTAYPDCGKYLGELFAR